MIIIDLSEAVKYLDSSVVQLSSAKLSDGWDSGTSLYCRPAYSSTSTVATHKTLQSANMEILPTSGESNTDVSFRFISSFYE